MRSFSEIETISKRASRGAGFSWGVSEEIGKSVRLLEMFGLPGILHLKNYLEKINNHNYQKITIISPDNISNNIPYCPISVGVNFLDQAYNLEKIENIRKLIDATGKDIELEVDGGINFETSQLAINAGADVLVAGTSTFQGGQDNYANNISKLRSRS